MVYLHTRENTNTREAKCFSVCSFDHKRPGGRVVAETLACLNILSVFCRQVAAHYPGTIKCPIVCWIFDSVLLNRKKLEEFSRCDSVLDVSAARLLCNTYLKYAITFERNDRNGPKEVGNGVFINPGEILIFRHANISPYRVGHPVSQYSLLAIVEDLSAV